MASLLGGLMRPKYTIGELMSIDQSRQAKAAQCKVSLLNTFYTLKEESLLGKLKSLLKGSPRRQVFYVTFKLQVKSDTGSIYNVFIQLDPDFDLSKSMSNNIKIYCGCADFKYRSAYALGQRDSLFLNGVTSSDLGDSWKTAGTGKAGQTLLCKHSFAALSWLLNNYSKIMSNL